MALSESEIQAKIDAIVAKLDELVASPQVDYSIGSKRYNASQYHDMLMKQLEYWEGKLKALPYEDVSAADYDISEFGEDLSEYEGDE